MAPVRTALLLEVDPRKTAAGPTMGSCGCSHFFSSAMNGRHTVSYAGTPSVVGTVEGVAQGRGGDCLEVFKE